MSDAEILTYMRSRAGDFRWAGQLDTAALAGDACAHFGLWVNDTMPVRLFDLADQVERGTQLFVERPIRYEEDGDVLWA